MFRTDDWLGRDVEIIETGERGRVMGVPITTGDSLTLSIRLGDDGTWCQHDDCHYHRTRHVTMRDGQESPVRVVE